MRACLLALLPLAVEGTDPRSDPGCSFKWRALGCTPRVSCRLYFQPGWGTLGPCRKRPSALELEERARLREAEKVAREMAKAEAEAMTKEMIAAQVRAEEERKAAAAAAEAVAVAAARARRKARAEAKRVAAAAEAAARAAAAEADRQNKRLMALGAACAVGLLLLVLMVFRGVRDAASTPITQEPAVPSAAAAVPAPHDKKKEQRAAAKRRAAQRKKAAWEQDAGNAQKLEEASLKKEASLKVAAHVPTERPLSPDSDLPPPPTAAADERDAKREAASSRYRRVLTAFKAGRIFSVATRRRAASLARGAASRARDSTDVAQAAPAPAPTPIPARRMAPTPIHPPNSPLGRFEAAVIRALKAGPGGVLTFRMTLQSLSPPPSMVPTLRLTTMRLTAQMLTGSREVYCTGRDDDGRPDRRPALDDPGS